MSNDDPAKRSAGAPAASTLMAPDLLRAYHDLDPQALDWVLRRADTEAEHRREMERNEAQHRRKLELEAAVQSHREEMCGRISGFVIVLAAIAGGTWLGYTKGPAEALAVVGIPSTAMVGLFLKSRFEQSRQVAPALSELAQRPELGTGAGREPRPSPGSAG